MRKHCRVYVPQLRACAPLQYVCKPVQMCQGVLTVRVENSARIGHVTATTIWTGVVVPWVANGNTAVRNPRNPVTLRAEHRF